MSPWRAVGITLALLVVMALPACDGAGTVYYMWDEDDVLKTQEAAEEGLTVLQAPDITPDGSWLLGWSTDPEATSGEYHRGEAVEVPEEGLVLYPVWGDIVALFHEIAGALAVIGGVLLLVGGGALAVVSWTRMLVAGIAVGTIMAVIGVAQIALGVF